MGETEGGKLSKKIERGGFFFGTDGAPKNFLSEFDFYRVFGLLSTCG